MVPRGHIFHALDFGWETGVDQNRSQLGPAPPKAGPVDPCAEHEIGTINKSHVFTIGLIC